MENRRKFYTGGLWSKDTLEKRYDHIHDVLSIRSIIDEEDLKFVIKNAFVSRIYISVEAEKKLREETLKSLQTLYNQLIKDGVLDLQDGRFGSKLSPYFDICKLGDKGLGIIIEHVVPAKVYLGDVKEKYAQKKFTFEFFKKVFDAVSICLVTDGEDIRLSAERPKSKGKGKYTLVSNMPEGYEDKFIDFPFARYEEAGIKIHGWDIDKGRLKRKTK